MTDKHTPGPWFAVPYGDGHDAVICEDEAGNQRIAFMAVPGSRDEQSRRKKWAEIKANARLIASAPDMATRITALEAEKAELVAATEGLLALVDDMSRFVGQMSLRDYALFNAAPIHARATLAKARQTEGEGNE